MDVKLKCSSADNGRKGVVTFSPAKLILMTKTVKFAAKLCHH